jgi:hypothetical protein
MDNVPSPIEHENSDYGAVKISADLRWLERRDLWAWMDAVVIILGLTDAVFSLPASLQWLGNEKRLSNSTRGSDVAARWGGDEFMMRGAIVAGAGAAGGVKSK